MKKKGIVVTLVVLVGVLAVPASNLVVGLPQGTSLSRGAAESPDLAPVVATLEAKCANCHTAEPKLPFYASLPPAKGILEEDMRLGRLYLDLVEGLAPGPKLPPNEAAVAMVEHVVQQGTMPPTRYLVLHWDGGLTAAERDALLAWSKKVRVERFALPGMAEAQAVQAVHPLPASYSVDPAKAELGRQLYNDVRLSGDDTVSCASCHDLGKGGTDQAKASTGIRGQVGGIGAPTTFNAVFQHRQFWDGRAATLEEQAAGPPENPIEMGSTFAQIVEKLSADEAFVAAFTAVYPAGLSKETLTNAIAEFERTLITPNSPFDRYLQGQPDALDATAQRGWTLFQDLGCQTCHVGKALGGQSFEAMGRAEDYFAARGGERTEADQGRFNFTKAERDRGRFKVPTLRNVARTFPYFHDGSEADLAGATRSMARFQLGRALDDADVAALVSFLESLTGTYQGKPL